MRLMWLSLIFLCGCQPALERQPRVKPYSELSTRLSPDGSVAQEDQPVATPELTRANLERGKDLYQVHCAVCHGFSGRGDGMVVSRGFPKPESLVQEAKPLPDIEKVIQQGQGKMYGLGERISYADRYDIAYYVSALQIHANPPKDFK